MYRTSGAMLATLLAFAGGLGQLMGCASAPPSLPPAPPAPTDSAIVLADRAAIEATPLAAANPKIAAGLGMAQDRGSFRTKMHVVCPSDESRLQQLRKSFAALCAAKDAAYGGQFCAKVYATDAVLFSTTVERLGGTCVRLTVAEPTADPQDLAWIAYLSTQGYRTEAKRMQEQRELRLAEAARQATPGSPSQTAVVGPTASASASVGTGAAPANQGPATAGANADLLARHRCAFSAGSREVIAAQQYLRDRNAIAHFPDRDLEGNRRRAQLADAWIARSYMARHQVARGTASIDQHDAVDEELLCVKASLDAAAGKRVMVTAVVNPESGLTRVYAKTLTLEGTDWRLLPASAPVRFPGFPDRYAMLRLPNDPTWRIDADSELERRRDPLALDLSGTTAERFDKAAAAIDRLNTLAQGCDSVVHGYGTNAVARLACDSFSEAADRHFDRATKELMAAARAGSLSAERARRFEDASAQASYIVRVAKALKLKREVQ